MANQVQAAAAAAAPQQPLSYFPEIAPTEEHFSATVDKAKRLYEEHYAAYKADADKIGPLAKEWGERHAKIVAGTVEPAIDADQETQELNRKVDEYIKFRDLRAKTVEIIGVFDAAIKKLTPPVLDTDTLKILQKLKIKMTDLQGPYDQVFTTDVDQLKAQKVKVKEVYDIIAPALEKLRVALEPLAVHSLKYSWTAYQAQKGWQGSATPLVKMLVTAREEALKALVEQPAQ